MTTPKSRHAHPAGTSDGSAAVRAGKEPLPRSGPVAHGRTSIVATASASATDAAADVLRDGGNAVDAAVAAAWALSVCEPSGSGLGGQTTLLVRLPDGRALVLDGHSRAPAGVHRKRVSKSQQWRGHRACTIPSTPATLDAALRRFGTMPAERILEPAIRLAEEGFPVTRLLNRHVRWCRTALSATEATTRIFLPGGHAVPSGFTLRQPELAWTLRTIAERGVEDFYRGRIARRIVGDMERHGGLLTAGDLAPASPPVEREPLSIDYRGHRLLSAPPPGGGLQLLLGMRLLEELGVAEPGQEAAWYEWVAAVAVEIFRERDRSDLRADRLTPSFVRWFLGDEHIAEVAARLRLAEPLAPAGADGPGETTHLCVADAQGMVVSLTQSIQSLFGAKVMAEGAGFFYNNYLCTCPRHPHPSELGPGAVPQSNAAPTIVLRAARADGTDAEPPEPVLAIGAAGSRRITTSVLQVATRCLSRGEPLGAAVDAPRVHATISGRVSIERRAASPAVLARLRERFPAIETKDARSYAMGAVQAVGRAPDGGWIGAADPRREGTARGD